MVLEENVFEKFWNSYAGLVLCEKLGHSTKVSLTTGDIDEYGILYIYEGCKRCKAAIAK